MRKQVPADCGVLRERPLNAADAAGHSIYFVADHKCAHAGANRVDDPRHVDAKHQW